MEFVIWLEEEKKLSKKSAHDVQSRLGRALNIAKDKEATDQTLSVLENNVEFKGLSMSVKSQLRRAVRLYVEYKQANK